MRRVISDDDIEMMLAYAEALIPDFKGRCLVPGDSPQIVFSFPEYTGEEEKYCFLLGQD